MHITKEIGRTPIGYERMSVTELAVSELGLIAATVLRPRARAVFCTIEDVAIRYRIDGGDPDQNEGHIVIAGSNLYLVEPTAIDNLRMIAIGDAVTAIVIVTYYF